MKKIPVLLLILFQFTILASNKKAHLKNSYQELSKKEKENAILENIHTLLEDTTFVFNATDMMVRGAGNVSLGYDCDVQVKKEMVTSYLPFIGKAYNVSPDIQNSGLDFTLPMQDYYFQKKRSGFKAGFKVKNGSDHMNFTFYISKTGYTTLTVGSTRRQSISFYGTFNDRK